jgi:HNH endonuclease
VAERRTCAAACLLKKLLCDNRVAPLWETGGYPVNVGRSMRIVPAHTRRLVEDRDRGCLFPGCHGVSFLEVHHLVHWLDGGPTDTWNLGCLCPFQHAASPW